MQRAVAAIIELAIKRLCYAASLHALSREPETLLETRCSLRAFRPLTADASNSSGNTRACDTEHSSRTPGNTPCRETAQYSASLAKEPLNSACGGCRQ
jgi:hypothetical protein